MDSKENHFPIVTTRIDVDSVILSDKPVTRPVEAIELAADYMFDMSREVGVAIFLDEASKPMCMSVSDKGNQTGVGFNQEEILRTALLCGASKFVLLHNHLSRGGDGKDHLIPSKEDVSFTQKMIKAASYVGLTLVDSVIVTATKDDELSRKYPTYYSMRAKKFKRMVKKLGKESRLESPQKESDILWEGELDEDFYKKDPPSDGESLDNVISKFNVSQINLKRNAGWYIKKDSIQVYEP